MGRERREPAVLPILPHAGVASGTQAVSKPHSAPKGSEVDTPAPG